MATLIDLGKIKNDYKKAFEHYPKRVIICAGTGCMAQGSMKIYAKLIELLEKEKIPVSVEVRQEKNEHGPATLVSSSGCQGFCQMGPLLEIYPNKILYTKVSVSDVEEIVEKTLKEEQIIERLLYHDPKEGKAFKGQEEIPFYTQQVRTSLKLCGHIDPIDIREYISHDGYMAAFKVWAKMNSEEVCNEVLQSGLRGRGGGGFPTGMKWNFARLEKSEKKYMICNGDEGDPGAFMDRSVLEGTPHAIIEGMMIAAYAIGANEGYIYLRMEYPLAVKRMKLACTEAEKLGILGDNVFGTGKSFHLHIKEGAGAFVCGEETALIASIEGKRGTPRIRPPFPAKEGLFSKPTVINNVETLGLVPSIILHGPKAFKELGTENSPGTKTFALTGHVANTGLIEVPFGTTLRKIIFDIGGGVVGKDGKIHNENFKAVQIGGPSGACLNSTHLDIPLDFDSVKSINAMIGSGGMIVTDQSTCIVDLAKYFLTFTQSESCGKCTFCRIGTLRMKEILQKICDGKGVLEDIDKLLELGTQVKNTSLCGLGQTAPNPILSTLAYFREEYLAHIQDKKCPAKSCKNLIHYEISPKCVACSLCQKACPVAAIEGQIKKRGSYKIDQEKCIKCGNCKDSCKVHAIEIV